MTKQGTKTVIYGQTGIGKTTLVENLFINEYFIDLSGGLSAYVSKKDRVLNLKDFSAQLGEALRSDKDTVVINTLDGLESLIFKDLIRESECKSIEHVDGGYSKGYVRAKEKWEVLLGWINQKLLPSGKSVVFLASCDVHEFKNPFGLQYNKFGLRINKHALGVIESEMDNIWFMTHSGTFNPEKEGVVIHTEPSVAFLAKNRAGLKSGLSIEEFHTEIVTKVLNK